MNNISEYSLAEKQSWSLEQKICHSLEVISTFTERLGGVDKVYVSFSGGKDSTVMLDLCQKLYPDILTVFVNTGNEWPEILRFVREKQKTTNIMWLRPKYTPRQVLAKYGFPVVSKDTANKIECIKRDLSKGKTSKTPHKLLQEDNTFKLASRWRYLLDEPYAVSAKCCYALKKSPIKKFERQTGRHPIVGVMASESQMRRQSYLSRGNCNFFADGNSNSRSISWPLAIWTEDDVLEYIERYNLPIADIYNKGVSRTGCVGCGFGAYENDIDNPSWYLLYTLYPKYYEMIMNYTNNRVTFREALRKMKAVTNTKLPDENTDLNYVE